MSSESLKSSRSSPLARRLVIATVAVSTIIAILATALQLYLNYRRDVNDIDSMLNQLEWTHAPSLSAALWSVNRNELQLAVEGIARLPDVSHVSIRDAQTIWASTGSEEAENPVIREFDLKYNDRGRVVPVGTLRVIVDLAGVYSQLLEALWVILATNAVKTFVVALFMLWFFRRLVTRHLDTLAGYARRLGGGDWSSTPMLERSKTKDGRTDELDAVVDSLTAMRDGLKLAHDQLSDSERRFRVLIENSNDAIFLVDLPGGKLLDANPLALRAYGYSHAEMLQLTMKDLAVTEDVDRNSQLLGLLLLHGQALIELKHRRHDGRDFPVESSCRSIRLHDHDVAVCVIRDLTERKKAEETLRKLSSAVEQSPNSILITDLSGTIEYVNPTFVHTTGFSVDESVGKTPGIISSPETPETVHQDLWRTITAGQAWHGEIRNRRKSGASFWDSVTVTPIKDERGNVTHYLGIQTDITRQKQREDEITRLNSELEVRVMERTAELESANHELESFSYSVSHDLRAPLRAIDGFSSILEDEFEGLLNETARNYLARMRGASQRMGQLIDDLLGLSRVTRAGLTLENVDLSQMARDIGDELTRADPQRRIAVSFLPGLHATGDRNLLHIAMFNLLENAWKYTRRAPNPAVAFGSIERHNVRAFYVRDNGAGFDMRYASKLFAPFQRLHGPMEFEGTGIGLATVARIIRRHGGRIWAESEIDRGATFFFTLGGSSAARH